jgi:hypothetical protein
MSKRRTSRQSLLLPRQKDEFENWLAQNVGIAKGKLTTDGRMAETRGED